MRYRWEPFYPGPSGRPGSADVSGLRVSDAERNEVAEKLSRHFADGRLDQHEFKIRLDRAMGAVTRADLDGLFDDLPRLAEEAAPPPHRHRSRTVLAVFVLLVVAAAASAATFSPLHVPWVLVAVVALLVWFRATGHRHRVPGSAELPR
jgi:Flp pilus assembly protein TadB